MEQVYDINWLSREHPQAFNSLPEPYQADNCLVFWLDDQDFYLKCQPKEDQQFALGTWIAYYDHHDKKWCDIKQTEG
jgi:hypothetical protein